MVKATYNSVKKKSLVWSEIQVYPRPKSECQYRSSLQVLKNRLCSNFAVRKDIISQQPLHRYYGEQFRTVSRTAVVSLRTG